jgi:hypothetical protein
VTTASRIELPHGATFVVAFFLGGPCLVGPVVLAMGCLLGDCRWESSLLLGGIAWWILVAFAPFTAPLTVVAPPLAGFILWASLRFYLLRFESLWANRWRAVVTVGSVSTIISSLTAAACVPWYERNLGRPGEHMTIDGFMFGPFGLLVAAIGALLGVALAFGIKLPRSNPPVNADARDVPPSTGGSGARAGYRER